MKKHQRPGEARRRDPASPSPAEPGKATTGARQGPSSQEVGARRDGGATGQQASGDYRSLPDDLDGMHADSSNPAVQAAGSVEEAADAARRAARDAGREADPLFTGSPGEEGPAPNIPSSLNMDRRASAAATGRSELREREGEHTASDPGVTAGDVDADWASGYFVGDETPAGDNPTPGMSDVEDVGKSIGVQYEDAEELKGAEKVEERDRRRWELDPASSEDYEERNRDDGKR